MRQKTIYGQHGYGVPGSYCWLIIWRNVITKILHKTDAGTRKFKKGVKMLIGIDDELRMIAKSITVK